MSETRATPAPIAPMLIDHHPLSHASVGDLQEMTARAFCDLATARAGELVGFSMTLFQSGGIPQSLGEIHVLTADGSGGIYTTQPVSNFVGAMGFDDVVKAALKIPSGILDLDQLDMKDLCLAESSPDGGYHLRTFWVFPTTALLLDNIQGVVIDEAKHLPTLAIPFYLRPRTQHERLARCRELNHLMSLARTAAIPHVIEEWPEGCPQDEIDFAPITSDRLELA